MLGRARYGEVSKLVDEHDLGSCAERRPGSSPGFPTKARSRLGLESDRRFDPSFEILDFRCAK
jgi:hypothetical protein